MELINPTITIQNVTGSNILVRIQSTFGNLETLDCTVAIPKGNPTLQELTSQALKRLGELSSQLAPSR